jgi:outer membrane protein assembly factor BamB
VKKILNIVAIIFSSLIITFFFWNCTKETSPDNNQVSPKLATITTTVPSLLTTTSLISGGNITNNGGDSVSERGICYSTSSNPTTNSNKIPGGSGNGLFTATITSLAPNTTYYIKAYAVNSAGTAYGDQVSLQTQAIDSAKLIFISGANALYCFNAKDGELKWAKTLGAVIYTSPCYENGRVYSSCTDGKLYCYDTSGNFKWSVSYGTSSYNFTPTAVNGLVYINNDNYVYAYDAVSGALKWQFDYYTPFSMHILASLTVYKGTVYASGSNIVALDAITGNSKWSFLTGPIFFKPKVHNNKVYVLNESLVDQELRVHDASTGNMLWKKVLGFSPNTAIALNIANGNIYLNKGAIIAMDTLDGTIKWTRGGGNVPYAFQGGSSPVVVDGWLHNVQSGRVVLTNANTGVVTTDYGNYAGGIQESDVTVVNGFAYYGTRDIFNNNKGRVYATTISDDGIPYLIPGGWASTIQGDFRTTPCVVTTSGKMYRAGDIY